MSQPVDMARAVELLAASPDFRAELQRMVRDDEYNANRAARHAAEMGGIDQRAADTTAFLTALEKVHKALRGLGRRKVTLASCSTSPDDFERARRLVCDLVSWGEAQLKQAGEGARPTAAADPRQVTLALGVTS